MKLLFLDGHVLTAGSVRMKGWEQLSKIGETMTQVVIAQAKEFGTVYYSDRALSLWPAGAERDATRAVASMSAVVTAMSERVEAELHTQSMLLQFGAFDLLTWNSGRHLSNMGKQDDATELFESQLRRVQTLAKAHKVINHDDVGVGLSNFAAIAKFLCKAHGDELRKRELDNRVAWTKVLHGRVPQRYVCGVVRQLVEWYISVTALTGGVERSLGRLVKTLEAHQGPLSEDANLIQALLHVDMDGPKHEKDIVNNGADTDSTATVVSTVSDVLGGNVSRGLRLTPFSRRCATLWVREHGRRFGVYKNGHAMAKRPQAENTDAAAARRQVCAFRSLEHFAESVVGQDSDCLTVLGMSRKTVQGRVRKVEGVRVVGQSVKLNKFREFSKKKCQLVLDEKSRRRGGGDAYLCQTCVWGRFSKTLRSNAKELPLVRFSMPLACPWRGKRDGQYKIPLACPW